MHAEKNGDEVIEEAGWREASSGVVTVRDDEIPEGKKGSLKSQIVVRSQNPNEAGDAKDNWTFSESLKPDFECRRVSQGAADAAYGSDTKASIKWFDGKRNINLCRGTLIKGRGRAEVIGLLSAKPSQIGGNSG